ncbi:hypothetical protein, partial [Bradyrhizobium sp. 142]|uniref:hypothetical protein n=1 Tax=Bradyrhizobium sp. 142 TaxID=2782618 RepID=UPI001FFA3796
TRRQYPWHDHLGGTVHAFRLRSTSTTKATDHELQKYDIFTRYGHGGTSSHYYRAYALGSGRRSSQVFAPKLLRLIS